MADSSSGSGTMHEDLKAFCIDKIKELKYKQKTIKKKTKEAMMS